VLVMNVNIPPPPPIVSKPYNTNPAAPVNTPQPAMAAALQSAGVTQTQTLQAASAVSRSEAPRRGTSGTETGQSVDTSAQALSSKSQGRGKLVDIKA
jgi:hypothetical protein